MKLWYLAARDDLPDNDNPWLPWYDKAFSFVVRAETEIEARQIAQENAGDEEHELVGRMGIHDVWLEDHYSACEVLTAGGEAGMIICNFKSA